MNGTGGSAVPGKIAFGQAIFPFAKSYFISIRHPVLRRAVPLLLLVLPLQIAQAQGTAFTYQGRLNDSGALASGSYDLRFTLFATNVAGCAVAGPVTNDAVVVTNGLFTTTVDLGGAFTGPANWLEIGVSTNAANAFSTLSPRQQLTPVPYAIFANTASNLSGVISASQLNGPVPASQIGGTIPLAQLSGAVVANGESGVAIGVTNIVTLDSSGFNLSNCVHFPFLNGYWSYDAVISAFSHNATNYFYNDVIGVGWVFAKTLQLDPDGTNAYLIDQEYPVSIPWNQQSVWTLNDNVTVDGAYITNSTILSSASTNMYVANNGVIYHVGVNPEIAAIDKWLDSSGQLLFDIELEGISGSIDNGKVTTYGTSYGIPWTNGMPGFTSCRYNGALTTISGPDNRGQVAVGFVFGNQGQYGGDMEYLVKRDTTYTFGSSGVGIFERSIVQDSHGGVQVGNTYAGSHGYKDDAPAWLEVWGGTPDKPTMLIVGGKLYTGTATNGAIQNDNTNIWITQGGKTGMVLTTQTANFSGFFTGNGSGLTNLNATQLTGTLPAASLPGITTNVSNGGITFYITNGLIMRVSAP